MVKIEVNIAIATARRHTSICLGPVAAVRGSLRCNWAYGSTRKITELAQLHSSILDNYT